MEEILKQIRLWKGEKVTDQMGMDYFLPEKESLATEGKPYRVSASLDMVGDITLTGNLTVQQSQHIYLRGPITSSAILSNGPLTASSLWIRDRSGDATTPQEDCGSVRVDGDIQLGGVSLRGQMEKINGLDIILGKCIQLEEEIGRLKREVEMLRKKVNEKS